MIAKLIVRYHTSANIDSTLHLYTHMHTKKYYIKPSLMPSHSSWMRRTQQEHPQWSHGVCVADTLRDLHGNLSPTALNCGGSPSIISTSRDEEACLALSFFLSPSFSVIISQDSDNCSGSNKSKPFSLI